MSPEVTPTTETEGPRGVFEILALLTPRTEKIYEGTSSTTTSRSCEYFLTMIFSRSSLSITTSKSPSPMLQSAPLSMRVLPTWNAVTRESKPKCEVLKPEPTFLPAILKNNWPLTGDEGTKTAPGRRASFPRVCPGVP